jgi:hypothetical protein
METRNTQPPPAPPGVITALISGFNAVANRAVILLIPFVFDLFLWLGPRFSIYNLVAPIIPELERMPTQMQGFPENTSVLIEFFEKANLFSALSTFPLGVFSLMSGNLATESPFGERLATSAQGLPALLLWVMALTVMGWLLGSLYFHSIARLVAPEGQKQPSLAHGMFQGFLLSGFWTLLWIVASLPVLVFVFVLMLISPSVASVVLMLISLLALWLSVPIFFSAHGIFSNADHFFRSLVKGFRLMRYALPSLGWFVIIAVVLSQGLNFLWRIPPADSWFTLLGIFGHAFITTALLAASFIYYRNLNIWIDEALQWIKAQTADSARA